MSNSYKWQCEQYKVVVITGPKSYGLLYINNKLIYYSEDQIKFLNRDREEQVISDILVVIYHDLFNYGVSIQQRELISSGPTTAIIESGDLASAEKSLLEAEKMLYNETKDLEPIEAPNADEGQFLLF